MFCEYIICVLKLTFHMFQLQEILFKSYFTDGEYPDVERVTSLAEGVGLNGDDVKAFISNPTHQNQIKTKARQWSSEGVSGQIFRVSRLNYSRCWSARSKF